MKSSKATYRVKPDGRRVTWLHRFDRPDTVAIGRLFEILEEMPVVIQDDGSAPNGFKRKDANAEPSRHDVVARLRPWLEEDYAENAEDYTVGDVGFDHVLSLDAHHAGNLAVMTRLFTRSEADSGNIYYGCETNIDNWRR